MADQPSPRRRFQFRLRTLMIVVTLLAVVCGYVSNQGAIVRQRKAILSQTSGQNAAGVMDSLTDAEATQFHLSPPYGTTGALGALKPLTTLVAIADRDTEPNWVRRWLGDQTMRILFVGDAITLSEVRRIAHLFPEANVYQLK